MRFIFTLFLIVAALLVAREAFGQGVFCGPRAEIVKSLEEVYQEEKIFAGLTNDNVIREIFANKKTRSWTELVTTPNGFSCIGGAGHDFNIINTDIKM